VVGVVAEEAAQVPRQLHLQAAQQPRERPDALTAYNFSTARQVPTAMVPLPAMVLTYLIKLLAALGCSGEGHVNGTTAHTT